MYYAGEFYFLRGVDILQDNARLHGLWYRQMAVNVDSVFVIIFEPTGLNLVFDESVVRLMVAG